MQPFTDDRPSAFPEGSPERVKQLQVFNGSDAAYALAKQHEVRIVWGTDVLYSPENAAGQGKMLSKMVRWYMPAQTLRIATADNAESLALSGPRSPYPGRLGVVQEGALADLLLVDGDPLANIVLVDDPGRNVLVIMKDGKIFENLQR
jgi:imidazolonepropionase-like amidohydrolase